MYSVPCIQRRLLLVWTGIVRLVKLLVDVSEVEPDGVRPSYPPLPPLMTPVPSAVVLAITVLGTRTRSQTRRAATILQSHNRPPSRLSPESSHIDHSVRSDTDARHTVAVSVFYFGSVPATPLVNCYMLLFTNRFSRRVDIHAVSAAEFTAEGASNIVVKMMYIPLWGFPASLLSDNGLRFLLQAVTCRVQTSGNAKKSPQAPIIPTVTAASSTPITPHGSDASDGLQRKTGRLGHPFAARGIYQFRQRRHRVGPRRGPHEPPPSPFPRHFRTAQRPRLPKPRPRPTGIHRPRCRPPTACVCAGA